jgi:alginate O-acetyltransferase complex protein AlgI
MLIIGLWHEFSYRYVLWGIWHGAGIAAWQLFQGAKPRLPSFTGLPRVITDGLSIVATFHFVVLSFVLVQEPELDQAAEVYRVLLTGWMDP